MLYLATALLSAASAGVQPADAPPKPAPESPGLSGASAPAPNADPSAAGAEPFAEPVAELLVAPQDADEPMNEWKGTINVGAVITSGNLESTALNASAGFSYRREDDRFTLGAWGNYAEQNPEGPASADVTARRYGMKGQYDYFVSEKTYLLATGRIEHDTIAGVHQRWIIGGGAGHQFLDEEDKTLNGELGLSYFNEKLSPGADKDYLALRAAYAATWQINDKVSAEQYGEIYPSLENSDDVNSRLDTRLNASLTEAMFAQFQWVWDWDNTPAAGNERSDHRFVFTLGWEI